MRSLAAKVEVALSKWLHDDVSIATTTFRLFPTPHLRVENVAVGKLLDAKAATGRIYLDPLSIFGDKLSDQPLEFEGVQVSGEAVKPHADVGQSRGQERDRPPSSSIHLQQREARGEARPRVFNADLNSTARACSRAPR